MTPTQTYSRRDETPILSMWNTEYLGHLMTPNPDLAHMNIPNAMFYFILIYFIYLFIYIYRPNPTDLTQSHSEW